MSLEMHSKFLEEVNRLAEQFSRLSLSDDIKRPSTTDEYYQFMDDRGCAKVKKSISAITNNQGSTGSKEALPTNAVITSDYSEHLIEDIKSDENLSNDTSSTILCSPVWKSYPVSESGCHTETCKKEMLPTHFENIDKTCTSEYNSNISTQEISDIKVENTFEKLDKTPEAKHETVSLKKDSISHVTILYNEMSIDAVKDDKVSNVYTISTLETSPQDVDFKDNELQPTEAVIDKTKIQKVIPSKFYAVALPVDAEHPNPNTLIFTELKDALSAVKSCKGSRFKEFLNKEDALQFASKPLEKVVAKAKVDDDLSTLRSATSQELCQLRKYIERGDDASFVSTVWKNPKILVGSCDTPSIMQEGMRYNALHVAAKSNKPYLCQLILDTIENPKFLQPIYPSKNETEREKIVYRLLDLYINTPDKKTGDTPLHYASKFGCLNCVKVLLAHPLCVSDRRNIAGFTPKEIICNRSQTKSMALIEAMEEAFKELLYIPVLRSEEDYIPPVIGEPCTCKEIIQSTRGTELKDAKTMMSLKAFVGPMLPEVAKHFYQVLRKPSSFQEFLNISQVSPEERKTISTIRYNDRENGVERIGRWLAKDSKVQWHEYFHFLDAFTNLASEEGLETLEKHLGKDHHVSFVSSERHLVFKYPSQVNPLSHYVNLHLNRKREKDDENKYDDIYSTPPSTPTKNMDGDCFTTPPSSPSEYSDTDDAKFLQGFCLSKLDVDVLLAIGNTTVNDCEYPNVSKWKSLVENRLENPEKTRPPCANPLSFLTSVALPRLQLREKICTPKKSLLNNAFCLDDSY